MIFLIQIKIYFKSKICNQIVFELLILIVHCMCKNNCLHYNMLVHFPLSKNEQHSLRQAVL